ncbi:MAG: 1-deoxy-D-xylulose-5-phosphate reductoisomerase [Gammaproteobacteria bacterium]|nr:1-deoxy-D-xylulose-5-phosphate reductoisomerase [Gammaproteobacteria bacterium]
MRSEGMHGVSVLGSTGSIGLSTLDVLSRHPERFRVVALSANHNVERLAEQCLRFKPELAVMADAQAAGRLAERLKAACPETRVLAGEEGLLEAAAHPEAQSVMAAIVGAAGLLPTLAAVRAGKRVLLANKEALVMSGQLFMDAVHAHGATLLPIDSEHNAVFQCMPTGFDQGLARVGVRRILLTGSGGPFRSLPLEQLPSVTPEQACKHPNWSMGRKISVDSATMMNKGLEVIEARWLFDAEPSRIAVVLHPQSVIHSMVEYLDGSVLAQMGQPDMRTPIAHALAWPERMDSGVSPLDLVAQGRLDFEAPDLGRFPCLGLAYEALNLGGTAMAVLNAANEIAVAAFLDGAIRFTDIAACNEAVLRACTGGQAETLEGVLAADAEARRRAGEWLKCR